MMARMHAAKIRPRQCARVILCSVATLALARAVCFLVSYWTLAHFFEPHSVSQPSAPLRAVQSCAKVALPPCNRFYRTEVEAECTELASTH